MKKFISAILMAVILVLALPSGTFAANITASQTEKTIAWANAKMQSGTKSYNYWCLKFVSDAFLAGGVTASKSYAYASLAGNDMVRNKDSNPPRGAVVFYDWYGTIDGIYRNWGHIGISLGGGKVIHADYNGIRVTNIYIDSSRKYRGWGVWGNNVLEATAIAPTPNSTIADGVYTIESRQGGNLNVYAGKDKDGTNVCIWQKDNSKEQSVRVVSIGSNKYKIYASCSNNGYGRVLDANRGTSYTAPLKFGLNIDIWSPNDAPAQEWYITSLDNGYYKIELANLKDGVMESAGSQNNRNVSLQKYTGSNAQQWKFVKQ